MRVIYLRWWSLPGADTFLGPPCLVGLTADGDKLSFSIKQQECHENFEIFMKMFGFRFRHRTVG